MDICIGGIAGFWIASFLAFSIGLLVGLAEILSRYRDDPMLAAGTKYGIVYCVLNGIIGALAFFSLTLYEWLPFIDLSDLRFPDLILGASAAGLGGMVLLRSRLFKVEGKDGEPVSIGPEFILDTLFRTIDTYIDKSRALSRTQLAKDLLAECDPRQLVLLVPNIIKSSRQNLAPEDDREIGRQVGEIASTPTTDVQKRFSFALLLINHLGETYLRTHKETLRELTKADFTPEEEAGEDIPLE